MRHVHPRWWGRWVVPILVLSFGLALPATGAAADKTSKLDPSVNALLNSSLATPWTELRVIAIGDAKAAAGTASFRLNHHLTSINGDSLTISAGELLKLIKSDAVKLVTADAPIQASTLPSVPLVPSALATLYPTVVGAPVAWSRGLRGEGVGIAVVDSGVTAQSAFASRLAHVALGGRTSDTIGHGTFVAGVAAGDSRDGKYVGIAPGATIYALNVSHPEGVYTSDVIQAVDWVLANHAARNIRVVNLSLNEAVTSSYLASVLCTAVERLWRAGVVVVASSGNTGLDSISHAPANDPFAITVGALDLNGTMDTGDDRVAEWSSRGTTVDNLDKPELVAPGRRIVSTLPNGTKIARKAPLAYLVAPGYAMLSGTSFAAPQVAAAAAIVFQQHPEYGPDQVKWVLRERARAIAASGDRALDLAAAVNFHGQPGSANAGAVQTTYGLVGPNRVAPDAAATWNAAATWSAAATWNAYEYWD